MLKTLVKKNVSVCKTMLIPEDNVLRSLLSVTPDSSQFLLKFPPEDVFPEIIP